MTDFSKAFDVVPQSKLALQLKLIFKLAGLGVYTQTLNWLNPSL